MAKPFRCTGCSLLALIEGADFTSTLRAERTAGTPACPSCGTSSWVDPYSFTAYYMKLPDGSDTCVVGVHKDASVKRVRLIPSTPVSAATGEIAIMKLAAGLCATHLVDATSVGIGGFLPESGEPVGDWEDEAD